MNKYLNVVWVVFLIVGIMSAVDCGGDAGGPGIASPVAAAPNQGKFSERVNATPVKVDRETFSDAGGKSKVAAAPSEYGMRRTEKTLGNKPEIRLGTGLYTGKPVNRRGQTPVATSGRPAGRSGTADMSGDKDTDRKIILNFDDADLYEVIKMMAELLDINYIVDPGVKGRVTIQTAGGFSRRELFPVFFQILEANNLTALQEGNLYKIVPMKDALRMPIRSRAASDRRELPTSERVLIQIIPLKYMSTGEMTKLVTPFLSSGGAIVASASTNTLVLVDKGANILKILQLVGAFDINVLDRVYYRFYPLKYLDAKEVSEIMKEFTTAYTKDPSGIVKFIALERLNTLLAVSTMPDVFDKIEELVHQIDIVDETVAARIFIYFVKNGGANELATLLNDVLTGKETQKQEKKKAGGASKVPGNPFSKAKMAEKKSEKKAEKAGQSTQKSVAGRKTSGEPGEGSSTLMGEMTITPDEIRNALIIESTPSDYKIVQRILKKIDIMPRQVLIQATIAEITLDSETKFGVEYALGQGAGALGAGFMATVGKGGLTYSIGVTNKWYAELNALATKGKLNVISSPHVLASDNQEAKIDVSREIPLASGSTTVNTGTTLSETTIEYRDTGVILSVTPHINERGLVTMDISQEVSNYEGNMPVGRTTSTSNSTSVNEYPVFSKRVVKTTLTVGHGQTIAIGGLIRDREKETTTGLPCLIDMPVIKYLTGSWEKQTEKIELIVLITPRVVDDMDDVEAMTNEFKQKVQSVMKQFYPQQ